MVLPITCLYLWSFRGKGVRLIVPKGNRYLNNLSSYSALGHDQRHPQVIQSLIEEANRVILTSRAVHNGSLYYFKKN